MILPISYPSAAIFWMQCSNVNFFTSEILECRDNIHPLLDEIPSNSQFYEAISDKYHIPLPIHYLSESLSRRNSNISKGHLCKEFPPNSFIEFERFPINSINGNEEIRILMASPEFCFLQAAEKFSLLELIKFGYDLCSLYVQDKSERLSREPITCAKKIEKFLSQVSWHKGIKKARTAIQYVVDRSFSPMETEMCMFAVLPYALGGFSIHKPELNKHITLTPKSAKILKRESCCCDMTWFDKKIIVEYDSSQFHLSKEEHAWDKAKETALSCSGYIPICLTSENFKNVASVQAAYSQIRNMLGLKNKKARLMETWDERRKLLHFFNQSKNQDPLDIFYK